MHYNDVPFHAAICDALVFPVHLPATFYRAVSCSLVHISYTLTALSCQLQDTCGVHNLHGIPGILGGLVAGFAAFGQDMSVVPHHSAQLGYQIAAILVTMALAIAGGVLAGALVSRFNPLRESVLDAPLLFDDGAFWTGVRVVTELQSMYLKTKQQSEHKPN